MAYTPPTNDELDRDLALVSRMHQSANRAHIGLNPSEQVRGRAERRQKVHRTLSSVAGASAVAVVAAVVWSSGGLSRLEGSAPEQPAATPTSSIAPSATKSPSKPGPLPSAQYFSMVDYESGQTVEALAEAEDPRWKTTSKQDVIDGGGIYRANRPGTSPSDPQRQLNWLPVPCGVKQKFNIDFWVNQGVERQLKTGTDSAEARILLQMVDGATATRLVDTVKSSVTACTPGHPKAAGQVWAADPSLAVTGLHVGARLDAPSDGARIDYHIATLGRFVWIAVLTGPDVPGMSSGNPEPFVKASFAASQAAIVAATEPKATPTKSPADSTPQPSSPQPFIARDYEGDQPLVTGLAELKDPAWKKSAETRVITGDWLYKDNAQADPNRRLDWLPRSCGSGVDVSPALVQESIELQQASRVDGTEARLFLQMSSAAQAQGLVGAVSAGVKACPSGWSSVTLTSKDGVPVGVAFEHRFDDKNPTLFRRYQLRVVGTVIWVGIVEGDELAGQISTDTQTYLTESFRRSQGALEKWLAGA